MKVKAYLNRLLREESSSMWGVRLIIKIILVLLVLAVYALLNTLVLESISDRAYALINPELENNMVLYHYVFSPAVILAMVLSMVWISNDFNLKRRSKIKKDSIIIGLILFALYMILYLPYIFYSFQSSAFFVRMVLFFLSKGANRAFLQVLLLLSGYFIINGVVRTPVAGDKN